MARESEGLKWALIVFVCLTILLGATSFIAFRQYSEASKKAAAASKKAGESDSASRIALADMEKLKQMMGVNVSDNLQTVQESFNADMLKFAADVPEEFRQYREVLKRLATVLQKKNEELDKTTTAVEDLKTYITSLDETTQPKIDAFSQEAQTAQSDKDAELAKFNEARDRLIAQQKDLDAKLNQTREKTQGEISGIQTKLDEVNQTVKKVTNAYDTAKGKIDAMTRENPDAFHGEVRWVNQHNKVTWINLGRADALRAQTTFSVYAVGANEMSDVDKKASIEVTRILGDHLAEARILQDIDADPIIPGDKIFTPVWNVGQKRHFSVAGEIDLDGDGRSDLDRLYALIEMNGGVVDARQDEEGKRQGKMSMDTRYLILGKTPDPKSSQASLEDYTKMLVDGENLRVETIVLEKFLDRMGWKNQSEVLVFGGGGSGDEFKVRPHEKPPQSGGNVSDLFKPRKPARKYGGSTF